MEKVTYRIIFEGKTVPGKNKDEIKKNLTRSFRLSDGAAAKLLSQQRAVIKKNISATQVDIYLSNLNKAGIIARKEPEQTRSKFRS